MAQGDGKDFLGEAANNWMDITTHLGVRMCSTIPHLGDVPEVFLVKSEEVLENPPTHQYHDDF